MAQTGSSMVIDDSKKAQEIDVEALYQTATMKK